MTATMVTTLWLNNQPAYLCVIISLTKPTHGSLVSGLIVDVGIVPYDNFFDAPMYRDSYQQE